MNWVTLPGTGRAFEILAGAGNIGSMGLLPLDKDSLLSPPPASARSQDEEKRKINPRIFNIRKELTHGS